MKSLKLAFAVLALAIGFGAPIANAQDAKKHSEADKAKAAYNLTDDQYKKVESIYKDAAKQKRAIPSDASDKKAKEAAINDGAKAKVRELLTPEQQAKFDEANKKPAAKNKGDGKNKGAEKGKGGDKKKKSQDSE